VAHSRFSFVWTVTCGAVHGFADSLNLSVASALTLQRLFDLCPELAGAMSVAERCELRAKWYRQLISNPSQEQEYEYWLEQQQRYMSAAADASDAKADRAPVPVFSDVRRNDLHRTEDWRKPRVKKKDTASLLEVGGTHALAAIVQPHAEQLASAVSSAPAAAASSNSASAASAPSEPAAASRARKPPPSENARLKRQARWEASKARQKLASSSAASTPAAAAAGSQPLAAAK
jgi:hypothetical protein